MFMWQIWLIVAGICFVLEIITVGFLIFWFGIGALIASLVSLVINNLVVQFAVFVFSSTLLLFFTKPLLNKFAKTDDNQTRKFSIIGKRAIVTKEINFLANSGQIKVGGEIWSAKSENESIIIPQNEEVEVVDISGVRAVVRTVKVHSSIS